MKKWQTAMVIGFICLSLLVVPAPQVKAVSALSIVGSIESKEVYTGHYSTWTIGDWAYLVTATVTSGGSPVSGVSVVADVIGPSGEGYWLRDGTQMLYDTVQGKGMDESGWISGPTYGGGTNDGTYANFLELGVYPPEPDSYFFGNHAGTWTIRLTASKTGYIPASTELTVNIVQPTGNYGHRFNFIDLDASSPEEDWVVSASPGQTLNAKLVYDETNKCSGCCVFYIRAWGCPYEEWGNYYDIDSGCTSYRSNVERTWTYTVPSTPGIYTMTLADVFAYWWPFYGENVGFVGKLIVAGPNNPPNTPSSPSPANHAGSVPLNADVNWSGGDPDGDSVTYDVYFEKDDSTPDQLVSDDQSGTSYDPGTLDYGSHYYWKIEAKDEHGATTPGPVWDFTTRSGSSGDTTAPAAVANLAVSQVTINSVTLTWKAPGDDGSTGTATLYDIRYSASQITQANWPSATQVSHEPSPKPAGTSESFTVTGLQAGKTYYFAMKTADEVPNWSAVSNSPSGTTLRSQGLRIAGVYASPSPGVDMSEPYTITVVVANDGATTSRVTIQVVESGQATGFDDNIYGPRRLTLDVPPGQQAVFDGSEFTFHHQWDWLKLAVGSYGLVTDSVAAANIALALLQATTVTAVVPGFLQVLNWLVYDKNAKKENTYTYTISGNFGANELTTVKVTVPVAKQFLVYSSLVYSLEASIATAAAIPAGLLSFGTLGIAFGATEVAFIALSKESMHGARDPDPNFRELVEPIPVSIQEVDSLPEGSEKSMAEAALQLLVDTRAMESTYSKYEGAKLEGDAYWVELQLGRAQMLQDLVQEDLSALKNLIDFNISHSGIQLTQDVVNAAKAYISQNSFPEVERNIAPQIGLSADDIANFERVFTAIPDSFYLSDNFSSLERLLEPGPAVTWDLPWGLDADPTSVNIWTYPGQAVEVTLADVEATMPNGLLVWYYGGPVEGWRFYKKGWGAANTLATLIPGKGYIGIVPTASVWGIPQG
jgi:hypothetical protein